MGMYYEYTFELAPSKIYFSKLWHLCSLYLQLWNKVVFGTKNLFNSIINAKLILIQIIFMDMDMAPIFTKKSRIESVYVPDLGPTYLPCCR